MKAVFSSKMINLVWIQIVLVSIFVLMGAFKPVAGVIIAAAFVGMNLLVNYLTSPESGRFGKVSWKIILCLSVISLSVHLARVYGFWVGLISGITLGSLFALIEYLEQKQKSSRPEEAGVIAPDTESDSSF